MTMTEQKVKEKVVSTQKNIAVSTYDIDFAGHVSNISYLRWFEDMRRDLFRQFCSLKDLMAQGQCPVLAATNIEYKRAIKLFDQPFAKMWISEVTKTTLMIDVEVYVQDVLTTKARHKIVFIDMASGRPVRLPESVRKACQTD